MITGASSGIGASTARALGGAGFTTVLGARRVDLLKQVAEESGGVAFQLDVTDTASVKAFAAEVDRRFGRVDVLVNNAGLALGLTPVESTPDKFWEGMWEANVHGLLRVTRSACRCFARRPSVIS